MKRIITLLIGALLALSVVAPTAFGQVADGSVKSGQARELSAAWWQWALAKQPLFTDPPVNSLIGSYTGGPRCDGKPVTETTGKKWFLAGSLTGEAVSRNCDVPVGRELFFPVVNTIALKTDPADTEESLRKQNDDLMKAVLGDPNLSTTVMVDGKKVTSNFVFRADSPPFYVTLPEIFGDAEPHLAVADGQWVLLPPLAAGNHTIRFAVDAPNADVNPAAEGVEGFSQDNTYNLTVK